MKAHELRNKSLVELREFLMIEVKKSFKLRMQLASGQLTETHELQRARRNIARIKTLLNEKLGE
ncbi:MAG: 50S ribosomal protein L29 [Porticoccaceae bacterium]|nr:50S ribosomal protein L29 [Porticoccaceae bacterium]|tara:strand:+ start:2558 stop:2749 length:192 start_codon:yes stop_codon:yes gene_type:complete